MEENVFTVEYIIENGLDKSAYGFVYITFNDINERKYIGQKKFNNQWKTYKGSGKLLRQALNKYGKDNFNRLIIAIAYSKEELNDLEIKFIKEYDAVTNDDYYNISQGGDHFGRSKGYRCSDEVRKNMSKPKSVEHKKKLSDFNKGKKMSEESKHKMSKWQIGRKLSEQHKRNIGNAGKGRVFSEESIKKCSEARRLMNREQVKEIREKYNSGKYKQVLLAKEYSVSRYTIMRIINFQGGYKSNPELLTAI